MSGPPSTRTQVKRHPERGVYEREPIDEILDEALICHLAWVAGDGTPRVIPTIHVRVGDTLYVHGSEASRSLRAVRDGAPVCVEATLIDGLVLARSTPLHSMNYRSVVVFASAREVTGDAERDLAQRALVEHVVPGRTAEVRAPTTKELKETLILALPLTEASAKVRTGPPIDPAEDLDLPVWAGTLPCGSHTASPWRRPTWPRGSRSPATSRAIAGPARAASRPDRGSATIG
jgi:nitroimidazol reductase NimA-like FMN-containing flavoprotein (pyridoxamine 5'-phosphate oxidase superfamily)